MTDPRLIGRRVLVVEDELMIAMLLEDMLGELGCEVVAAVGRSVDALKALEGGRIDAAVVDVNLSGGRSDAVARALMARGVPFVIATGADPRSLTLAEHRERPVLKKPFRIESLAESLARALTPRS